MVVRRRFGNHATDVIGHVEALDPLVIRPQKVGGLPSDAAALTIPAEDILVIRRLSPRRIRNSDIRAVETAYARAFPCLLYTSPSPRDRQKSRMPSSA